MVEREIGVPGSDIQLNGICFLNTGTLIACGSIQTGVDEKGVCHFFLTSMAISYDGRDSI